MMTLLEWITTGEVGISSKTMWAAIMGTFPLGHGKGWDFDVPHDGDDFRRCLELVNKCQLGKKDLQKVKNSVPWFAPFIDNWDLLVKLYDEESPSGQCPKLYEYIKYLEDESWVLAGWERTGPGSWQKAASE